MLLRERRLLGLELGLRSVLGREGCREEGRELGLDGSGGLVLLVVVVYGPAVEAVLLLREREEGLRRVVVSGVSETVLLLSRPVGSKGLRGCVSETE